MIIKRTFTVTSGGVEREVSAEEALQQRTYQEAIQGNRAAQREVLRWIQKREKAIAATKRSASWPEVSLKFTEDPDNVDEVLLLLGITRHNIIEDYPEQPRKHLLLEPWAVQMALSRRRGGQRLTDDEIEDIERCTAEFETLRWPRRRND